MNSIEKKYEEVVETFRYIRPPQQEDWGFWGNEWVQNLYGITIKYTLDYPKGNVTAKWSICSGDNFSKKEGKIFAENSDISLTFPIEDVESYKGLTNSLMVAMSKKLGHNLDWKTIFEYNQEYDYGSTHNVFLVVSRLLKKEQKSKQGEI